MLVINAYVIGWLLHIFLVITLFRFLQCAGELQVSLCHEATSSYLKVKVMKIKDLPKSIKSMCRFVLPRVDCSYVAGRPYSCILSFFFYIAQNNSYQFFC